MTGSAEQQMEIVKAALDVGLFTGDLEADLAFWQALGLPSEPHLKLGGGIHQHRFRVGSSVLKVNHALRPLQAGRSGLRAISILRPGVTQPAVLVTPGGAAVHLAGTAELPGTEVVVHLDVGDCAAHGQFWSDVLQLQRDGPRGFRCGSSLVELTEVPHPPPVASWKVQGWSYLTVQVRDCAAAHSEALQRGAWEGEPPRRMGNAAVISFVRDPDGNFVELSEKADIVRALG